ncbi:MAG TPA: urea ABC transporter ATP-binding protein UrtD [Candidatus Acidoferrales bacterium]|nr:urea ABC transporter ATP-binding protein UrtD [Candidatus Acidoferrales bacterium]
MSEPLLRVENLVVSFDGFRAVDRMNLTIQPREVRVLIGPNGAGKSTLLDAIIGHVRPASGRVLLNGQDVTRLPEYKIVRKGICRKFQAPGVLENLTVAENVAVAAQRHRGWWRSLGRRAPAALEHDVEEVLHLIGLGERRHSLAKELAHGQKQWLEIGMVVASNAELLLLDEPAAGMTHGEATQTAELIRRLSQWHSFLVIDHDMSFVAQLEAPVTVLHQGRLLKEGTLEEVRNDPQVAAVYLGRAREESGAGA